MATSYTTNAPFLVKNNWQWVRWTHSEPNRHAAILDKAKELNASAWDFGQADHYETSRYPFGSR